ncbi:MAG: nucleotidyl transferase AbiEii/AbiGii toxin family protein [Gammaproteobacteria bacterium]
MSYSRGYLEQVKLLLQVLPIMNEQDCFALKGGTAINLFLRDMPRLSVDIDLTYLPIEPREIFLKNITSALDTLADNIRKRGEGQYQVDEVFLKEPRQISKLLVFNKEIRIIIEPNLVLRGSVFDCETHGLCQSAQDQFLSFFRVKTLSFADIYAGKICAALARQHPRDLFDVKILLENEGITDPIRQAFVIYLASNSRPIHEILNPTPNLQNMQKIYDEGFSGMTKNIVPYEQLVETRLNLIKKILKELTTDERKFLLSIKEGEPNWSLIPIPGIEKLPGLAWKSINIKKMEPQKQKDALEKLKKVLDL